MPIQHPEFVKSAIFPKDWPSETSTEVCFCGRSNVGKSSLLNGLLGQTLARVSKTPGRTRMLHFFRGQVKLSAKASKVLSFADLPGFGYAQVSKKERHQWFEMVERYITQRTELQLVFLLIDARRLMDLQEKPTMLQEEQDLFHYLQSLDKKVIVVVTKADKIQKTKRKRLMDVAAQFFPARAFLFSALTKEGLDVLEKHLQQLIKDKDPGA